MHQQLMKVSSDKLFVTLTVEVSPMDSVFACCRADWRGFEEGTTAGTADGVEGANWLRAKDEIGRATVNDTEALHDSSCR